MNCSRINLFYFMEYEGILRAMALKSPTTTPHHLHFHQLTPISGSNPHQCTRQTVGSSCEAVVKGGVGRQGKWDLNGDWADNKL